MNPRGFVSWVLFVALLPTLTFLGHWQIRVDIPGTEYYVGMPEQPHTHSDTHDGGESGHHQHCHADAASCSDVPAAAGVSVTVLWAAVAALLCGALTLRRPLTLAWRPPYALSLGPVLQPPRVTAAPA